MAAIDQYLSFNVFSTIFWNRVYATQPLRVAHHESFAAPTPPALSTLCPVADFVPRALCTSTMLGGIGMRPLVESLVVVGVALFSLIALGLHWVRVMRVSRT